MAKSRVGTGFFDEAYATHTAAWAIGRPQPAVEHLVQRGQFKSPIIDVGCGLGDNAIAIGRAGLTVHGVDASAIAVREATRKAVRLVVPASFEQLDVLREELPRRYNTALDSGVFHGLALEDQRPYAHNVAHAVRPGGLIHVLAVKPGEPTRAEIGASPAEILDAFAPWVNEGLVRQSSFTVEHDGVAIAYSAWLVTMVRGARRRRRLGLRV